MRPEEKQVKASLMVNRSFGPGDQFRWKYGHKYDNVGVDMDRYLRLLQPAFLPCELVMFASCHHVETQPLVVEER